MYLVCYDISSNKRRGKIAKELKNYGSRIQYSVFQCDINKEQLFELYKKLLRLTEGMSDGSILFFKICSSCEKERLMIGISLNHSISQQESDIIIL